MIFNTISRYRTAIGGWHRRLCSKPTVRGSEPPPANVPAHAPPRVGFKLPGYRPSEMDMKILIWSGRFKTKEQIPELVSFEMIDAARNRVRVKACYGMMIMTIVSCLVMVFFGKRAAGRNESLTAWNMQKKALLREEAQRELEEAAASALAAEKAQ